MNSEWSASDFDDQTVWFCESLDRFRFLKTRLKVTEFKVGATSEAFEFQAFEFKALNLGNEFYRINAADCIE